MLIIPKPLIVLIYCLIYKLPCLLPIVPGPACSGARYEFIFDWLSLLGLIGSCCLSDWLSLDPKTFLKRMLGFPVLTAVYHTLDHMCLHVPACACMGDAFLLLANDAKCLVMAQLL